MTAQPRPPVAPVVPTRSVLRPIGIDEVTITGGFWGDRQRVNAEATIPHAAACEEAIGWVDNFRAVADGTVAGRRRGRTFSDSEVYKLLEAMAWEAARSHDDSVEERLRALTSVVARAQAADGYLGTSFGHPGLQPRYSDLEWGHELYSMGHLIQAAVARLRGGHDDQLVAVARRVADHLYSEFGPDGRSAVCGHPEVEVALAELSRATGDRRYLELARLFVERRGHGLLADIELGRGYYQDDLPVRETKVLRGHAVRALYLTAGAADVAVEAGDDGLLDAVRSQYATTLARRTYLTGGMGSRHEGEAFGDDFELPPDRAYCETCAGIASVMVSWRLLLATGDPAYADVVERTLFNVVAAAPSPDGRSFFYTNPLHKRDPGSVSQPGEVSRRAAAALRAPWYEVSCCPTNLARTLASLAAYAVTVTAGGVQVHQYALATVRTQLVDGSPVALAIDTDYPQSGSVTVTVTESSPREWELSLRVPSWAAGAATLDGRPVGGRVARVRRQFRPGDVVRLDLPMSPRFSWPDERIDAVRGCVAVERGPLVLCAESVDLPGGMQVDDIVVDLGCPPREDADGVQVTASRARLHERPWPYSDVHERISEDGRFGVRLVPYYSWANRGPATMRVWLPASWPVDPAR